jgi:hypothetical protein
LFHRDYGHYVNFWHKKEDATKGCRDSYQKFRFGERNISNRHVHKSFKNKMRLFVFRHTIGDPTACSRLHAQAGTAAAPEEHCAEAIETRASSTLRLHSKFNILGNVYEVLAE